MNFIGSMCLNTNWVNNVDVLILGQVLIGLGSGILRLKYQAPDSFTSIIQPMGLLLGCCIKSTISNLTFIMVTYILIILSSLNINPTKSKQQNLMDSLLDEKQVQQKEEINYLQFFFFTILISALSFMATFSHTFDQFKLLITSSIILTCLLWLVNSFWDILSFDLLLPTISSILQFSILSSIPSLIESSNSINQASEKWSIITTLALAIVIGTFVPQFKYGSLLINLFGIVLLITTDLNVWTWSILASIQVLTSIWNNDKTKQLPLWINLLSLSTGVSLTTIIRNVSFNSQLNEHFVELTSGTSNISFEKFQHLKDLSVNQIEFNGKSNISKILLSCLNSTNENIQLMFIYISIIISLGYAFKNFQSIKQ